MNRKQIKIKVVKDVEKESNGQYAKEELLRDSEFYDKENYNPLENEGD